VIHIFFALPRGVPGLFGGWPSLSKVYIPKARAANRF
jgi:hypothetical protein